MRKRSGFWAVSLVCILVAVIGLTGCSDSNNAAAPSPLNEGVLLDGRVSGVGFQAPSSSGFTSAQGLFTYMPGELVQFFVGGTLLGQALGGAIMTPMDLVGIMDPANVQVNNICRFLQTLDQDGDPTNGIQISDAVRQQLLNQAVNLGGTALDFENSLQPLLDQMNLQGLFQPPRAITSAADALNHFTQTLKDWGINVPGPNPPGPNPGGGLLYSHQAAGALRDIAVDSAGNVFTYWYNNITHEVWKIAPDGAKTVFSANAQLDTVGLSGDLYSLWVDPSDVLWGWVGDSLVEFANDGAPTVRYTEDGAVIDILAPAYLNGNGAWFFISDTMGLHGQVILVDNGTWAGQVMVAQAPDGVSGIGQAWEDSSQNLIFASNHLLYSFNWANPQAYLPNLDGYQGNLWNAYAAIHAVDAGAFNQGAGMNLDAFALDDQDNVLGEAKCLYTYNNGQGFVVQENWYQFSAAPDDATVSLDQDITGTNETGAGRYIAKNGNLYWITQGKLIYVRALP